MNKHVIFSAIIISGFFTQPLSAMLALRSRILSSKAIRPSLLLKNKRCMTSEVNTQKFTQETNQTYLQRYPHLNLLANDSILRVTCEKEVQLINNKMHQIRHYYNGMKLPLEATKMTANGNESLADLIVKFECLENGLRDLEKKLQLAYYLGKSVQQEDQFDKHKMFKYYSIVTASFLIAAVEWGIHSPLNATATAAIMIGLGALSPIPFTAVFLDNQSEITPNILRKIFQKEPKQIQDCALMEYYQLSDKLVNEREKEQKELYAKE